MATPQDLSTPHCPAEYRAWLLIYQKRIGWGKRLTQAFNKKFPDHELKNVLACAGHVRDVDDAVQSQLLEFAKQFAWYEEPPQEGEQYYKNMKKLERQQEARERNKAREAGRAEGLMDMDVGGDDGGQSVW